VELSSYWEENPEKIHYFHHWWGEHIQLVMQYKKMPEKLQFWTRAIPDYTDIELYDGRRLDLLHPMMWFDN